MTGRNIIKQLVPPVFVGGVRWIRARFERKDLKPALECIPGGWEAAESNGEAIHGWNVDRIAEVEASKWKQFCENLTEGKPLGFSHEHIDLSVTRNLYFHNIHISYAYVLALVAVKTEKLRILDIGGGLGHYYQLSKSVLPKHDIHYTCYEVPSMCQQGEKICPGVSFTSDESCFNQKYDLVMINGSLGYFKDWKGLLRKAIQAVQGCLFLTRVLAVQNVPSFVVLQRTEYYGYNSNMITQVFNESELVKTVRAQGMTLEREFVIGSKHEIYAAPEACEDKGWLFSGQK
jgi:putative methyltransferase (TIGR04325 family)